MVSNYRSGGDIGPVQDSARKLQSQLRGFDQDAMRADIGIALAIQKPGKVLGIAIFADATLRANIRGDLADSDDQFFSDIIAASNGSPVLGIGSGGVNERELQSSGRIIAAAMSEAGLTLSREFELGDNALALGISPKFVQLRTFDYQRVVSSFDEDDFDAGDDETHETGFNMDLGAAYTFGSQDQWIAGASIRNLMPMDIRTVNGEKVELIPLLTLGIAHRSEWHTLAVDLDLTKNKAFSFEDDTQWLAVGGEVDVFNSLQLRAGVRHNVAHESRTSDGIAEKNQFTAGVALSPLGLRVELSGMIGGGEVGAAAEPGVMF